MSTDFFGRVGAVSDAYGRSRDYFDGRLYAVYSALTQWQTAPLDLGLGYALAEGRDDKAIWIVKIADGGIVYAFNTNRSVRLILHDCSERIAVPAPLPVLRALHRDQEQIVQEIKQRFATETAPGPEGAGADGQAGAPAATTA